MEEKSTYLSWCDPASLPSLNPHTVVDYFCKPTNPFYDRTCNNESLRMQGFGLISDQLMSMEGVEFSLLHAHPPDLFVIRKQHRLSPQQVSPLVDYYIIKGVVYQSPDLGNVLNARLLNAVHAVRRALDEATNRAKFSWSKSSGTSLLAGDTAPQADQKSGKSAKPSSKQRQNDPDRPPTAFQKMHVDPAIADMVRRFPAVQSSAVPSAGAQQPSSDKPGASAQEALQPSGNSSNSSKRAKTS